MADRYLLMEGQVKPALSNGQRVISVRSYLSTAVYQSGSDSDAYSIMLAHNWVPPCDLLIVLDLEVEDALMRIGLRNKPAGDYETESDLRKHRMSYLRYASVFNARGYRLIDARREKEAVAADVMTAIRECCTDNPAG